jgi:hypothetical protein
MLIRKQPHTEYHLYLRLPSCSPFWKDRLEVLWGICRWKDIVFIENVSYPPVLTVFELGS